MTNENMSTEDKQRQAQDLKNHARADAHELSEKAKLSAHELRDKGEQQARAKAEVGRDQAAGQIDSLAHAARAAADDLRENQHDALSQYVGSMASTVGEFADSLRHKSVDELVRDVEGIARRNPALFIAGSVAVGLGIARFAKASSDRRDSAAYAGSYQSDSDYQSYSGTQGDSSYQGGADYAGARGYTDSRQPSLQPGYDSQYDYNRGFGATSRDNFADDSLASENSSLVGADADRPETLVERDLGGEDSASDAFLVKDRDDKPSDKSTNI